MIPNMETAKRYFPILIITCLFLISSNSVWADRGSVSISPRPIKLSQDSQRAIIMHNAHEEVLILGTEVRAEKETEILEFIPFPSEPTVKLTAGDPFEEIARLMQKKGISLLIESDSGKSGTKGGGGGTTAPIEIKLSQKIGLHDVTVIKINDISAFTQWVAEFFSKKGVKITSDLSSFYKNAEDYVKRGINYFVFDYVAVKTEKRSIEPLLYRFKTDKIYYPLKTSNVIGGHGIVDLIFICPGSFAGRKANSLPALRSSSFELSDRITFGLSNSARIYPEEIETIYPEAKEFFAKTKKLYIQVMRYTGPYNFQNDFFFDISKLDSRTYDWDIYRFDWEYNFFLRPGVQD